LGVSWALSGHPGLCQQERSLQTTGTLPVHRNFFLRGSADVQTESLVCHRRLAALDVPGGASGEGRVQSRGSGFFLVAARSCFQL